MASNNKPTVSGSDSTEAHQLTADQLSQIADLLDAGEEAFRALERITGRPAPLSGGSEVQDTLRAMAAASQAERRKVAMELSHFGPAVFETIASMWDLAFDVTGVTSQPCCDDPGCGGELGLVTIRLDRPGAESFAYVATMDVDDLATTRLTPAWVLSDISHLMIETPHTAKLAESFRQFCWAPEGNEPQLQMEHLRAFAIAADALEFFVLPVGRGGGEGGTIR
jgi:hypothetical protein